MYETCNCRHTIRYPKKVRTHFENLGPMSASFHAVEHLRQKSQGSAGLDRTTDKHSDSRFPIVVCKSNQIRNCTVPMYLTVYRGSTVNHGPGATFQVKPWITPPHWQLLSGETMRAGGNNSCPFKVLNWFWCHWSAQPMTPKVNSVTAGSLTRKAPGRFRRAIFRVRLSAGRNQRGAGSNIHSTQAGREASCAGPGSGGRGPPGRLVTVRLRASGILTPWISQYKSLILGYPCFIKG